MLRIILPFQYSKSSSYTKKFNYQTLPLCLYKFMLYNNIQMHWDVLFL